MGQKNDPSKQRLRLRDFRVGWWGWPPSLLLVATSLATQSEAPWIELALMSALMALLFYLPISFLVFVVVRSVRAATIVLALLPLLLSLLIVGWLPVFGERDEVLAAIQERSYEVFLARERHENELNRLRLLSDGSSYYSRENEAYLRHLLDGRRYVSLTEFNLWQLANFEAELCWIGPFRRAKTARDLIIEEGGFFHLVDIETREDLGRHIAGVREHADAWRRLSLAFHESHAEYARAMDDPLFAERAARDIERHARFAQDAASAAEELGGVIDQAARGLGYLDRFWGKWWIEEEDGQLWFDDRAVSDAVLAVYNAITLSLGDEELDAYAALGRSIRDWTAWATEHHPSPEPPTPEAPDEP